MRKLMNTSLSSLLRTPVCAAIFTRKMASARKKKRFLKENISHAKLNGSCKCFAKHKLLDELLNGFVKTFRRSEIARNGSVSLPMPTRAVSLADRKPSKTFKMLGLSLSRFLRRSRSSPLLHYPLHPFSAI